MTTLSQPDRLDFEQWRDCINDYGQADVPGNGLDGVTPSEADFRRAVRVADRGSAPASRQSSQTVRVDYFWIRDESRQLIGFLSLRHAVDTPFLRERAGHIGFSVRPSCRGQGHASRALGLALHLAHEVPLRRVLLICKRDNTASARTIESQGGVLAETTATHFRYWVELGLGPSS